MIWEQGPIRPPSEAGSLLLRVTRNCPWNRCTFCATYKGERFSRRAADEILAEIQHLRRAADKIEELAGGPVTDGLAQEIYHTWGYPYFYLAHWLNSGGRDVFLQDADSLVLPAAELAGVLRAVREAFPTVRRITSYARAATLARKKPEDLAELKSAGLSRVHVGLESGCDEVLARVRKGVTAGEAVRGGRQVVDAGLALSFYVLVGLGGRRFRAEHPRDTAAVINAVHPAFVRLRSLSVRPGSALQDQVAAGEFAPLSEDEQVAEILDLLSRIDPYEGYLASDHALNVLGEVEGNLARDREPMMAACRRYLALPPAERVLYRLGRRQGEFAALDDLAGPRRSRVEERLSACGDRVEEVIAGLTRRFF